MENSGKQPLLEMRKKKVYYENCPGCKVDRRNDTNSGIPYKEFCFVWVVVLSTALPISSLFPFLYFMIRDTHIAEKEEDIGFYAGFVGASFMFGRALTSVMWGIVADRYGRKPVIMFGIVIVVVFNTLFGLSKSYWMAISTRFFLGFLNGNLGPIKAYASEISREEHQAMGLSLVSTAWAVGLIIGPAIGGFLSQPAEKYPNVFSHGSLFGRFPYLLPCLCISMCAAVVLFVSLWLPETLHMNHPNNKEEDDSYEALEASLDGCNREDDMLEKDQTHSDSKKSLLRNWPLMSSIIVYCVFSFHDMAYSEIFSLWAVSPKMLGGLGFTTDKVGVVLAISGAGLFFFTTFLYPVVERPLGPIKVARVASLLSVPVLQSYPFIAMLSGISLSILLNSACVLKNVFSTSIITGLFVLQNNAVPQSQRGAANGISMTGQSIFKAFGPALGGIVFSWAQKRRNASFLPGSQIIFFLLNVVEVLGLILTFKPFLVTPNPTTRTQ